MLTPLKHTSGEYMSRIFILYEHHKTDKYIIAAGYNFLDMMDKMIHQKANGPKELIELSFDHIDGSGPEERTVAIEGGALHKAASFREDPELEQLKNYKKIPLENGG